MLSKIQFLHWFKSLLELSYLNLVKLVILSFPSHFQQQDGLFCSIFLQLGLHILTNDLLSNLNCSSKLFWNWLDWVVSFAFSNFLIITMIRYRLLEDSLWAIVNALRIFWCRNILIRNLPLRYSQAFLTYVLYFATWISNYDYLFLYCRSDCLISGGTISSFL